MNYAALRHVVEACGVEGPGRAILFVIAYRADRHTGEAWVSLRRLAAEAGVDYATVKRQLPALMESGHLARVLRGTGRRSSCYQIIASGRSVSPNGYPVVGADSAGADSAHYDVVGAESSRSGRTGGSVVGAHSTPPYRKEGKSIEGFEGGGASPSPSPVGDASAPLDQTRCRHRNDPDTCGVCSGATGVPPPSRLSATLQPARPTPEAP